MVFRAAFAALLAAQATAAQARVPGVPYDPWRITPVRWRVAKLKPPAGEANPVCDILLPSSAVSAEGCSLRVYADAGCTQQQDALAASPTTWPVDEGNSVTFEMFPADINCVRLRLPGSWARPGVPQELLARAKLQRWSNDSATWETTALTARWADPSLGVVPELVLFGGPSVGCKLEVAAGTLGALACMLWMCNLAIFFKAGALPLQQLPEKEGQAPPNFRQSCFVLARRRELTLQALALTDFCAVGTLVFSRVFVDPALLSLASCAWWLPPLLLPLATFGLNGSGGVMSRMMDQTQGPLRAVSDTIASFAKSPRPSEKAPSRGGEDPTKATESAASCLGNAKRRLRVILLLLPLAVAVMLLAWLRSLIPIFLTRTWHQAWGDDLLGVRQSTFLLQTCHSVGAALTMLAVVSDAARQPAPMPPEDRMAQNLVLVTSVLQILAWMLMLIEVVCGAAGPKVQRLSRRYSERRKSKLAEVPAPVPAPAQKPPPKPDTAETGRPGTAGPPQDAPKIEPPAPPAPAPPAPAPVPALERLQAEVHHVINTRRVVTRSSQDLPNPGFDKILFQRFVGSDTMFTPSRGSITQAPWIPPASAAQAAPETPQKRGSLELTAEAPKRVIRICKKEKARRSVMELQKAQERERKRREAAAGLDKE